MNEEYVKTLRRKCEGKNDEDNPLLLSDDMFPIQVELSSIFLTTQNGREVRATHILLGM